MRLGLFLFLLAAGATLAFAQFQQFQKRENRLRIQVVRHQPCRANQRPTKRPRTSHRRYSSNFDRDSIPGCYRIRGDVQVNERLSNRAQMYLMVHYSVDPREGPEQCHGFDANTGCGGWGSCLYCDACRAVQTGQRALAAVSLTKRGRQINCYEDLGRGIHHDVELKFCMPTKREFLRNQGWTEQTWNSLVGSRARGHAIGVFLTITIFDSPQNYWVNQQRLEERQYRAYTGVPPQEKIPMSIQREWSFYKKVVKHNSGFVGCHRIYGNLIVQQ